MATFLFTWELGGGLGHVTVIKPLAAELAARGHRVVVALRDVSSAKTVFGESKVAWLQAPIKVGATAKPIEPIRTFAHVLHNTSFAKVEEASSLVQAWLNLFDLVRPAVVVCDHSPIALLAARIAARRSAVIGPGFYCPAVVERYPDWRPWLGDAREELERQEAMVLGIVNACLDAQGGPRLARLSDLYATDLTLLGTYPELDPFGKRPGVRYRGAWGHGQGVAPWWPPGKGKRIFAYVKSFKGIGNLLEELQATKQPCTVFCPDMAHELAKRYAGPTIAFAKKPVELAAAAQQCDVAITHGSHGTAAAMLLAAKPQLLFPLHLEQRLTSQAIVSCGAGLAAKPDDRAHIKGRLERLLSQGRFTDAAKAVSERHRHISPATEIARSVDELEALAATS